MHNFSESLKKSHDASDLPIWGEIYKKAFPDMATMVDHRQDGEHQRAGIDRSIILASSKQILIDEKARFPGKNGKVYDDILLEFISNDKTGALGWVCKPLRADYICYAITAIGRAYLLPVPQLQLSWAEHGDDWKSLYDQKEALNQGYSTWNCPVPADVLFKAIGKSLRISFTPIK